jgi:carbohydrate kinase (thermoresistant glucokinase family)
VASYPAHPPGPASPTAPAGIDCIIVMGVSGVGKSTIGQLLAARLGWPFRDADSFHPPANVAKMSAGTPLTDEDRWPWLDAIGRWLDGQRAAGAHGVATCSALKRIYRQRLLGGRPDVRLVHLSGSRDLIAARMAARRDHFMPTALLESQLATLEPPTPDENALIVDIDAAPEAIVASVLARLG